MPGLCLLVTVSLDFFESESPGVGLQVFVSAPGGVRFELTGAEQDGDTFGS